MELGVSQLLLMKMIVGHGIDIEELASIQNAVEKREGFAQRVLTDKEMERFASLKGRRQMEYLAGRWSAKEAFSKAMGTGIGKLGFQDLEVLNNERGAPYFSKSPFSGKVWHIFLLIWVPRQARHARVDVNSCYSPFHLFLNNILSGYGH